MANSTTQARAGLVRAKYSGLDFDTILDDVLARAQAKYAGSFNNLVLSDLGVVLIESFAVAFDQLAFYLDRRATDTYLALVRTYRNASYLARQLGYPVSPAVSSSVDLTVSLETAQVFDAPIQKGFQFQGPNNLIFEAAREVTFLAGSGPTDTKKIPVYQGETIIETFTSTGAINQSFALQRVRSGQFIVIGSVDVTVDGLPWEEKDLLVFGALDEFEIGYGDNPAVLRFGDGIVGNVPAVGTTITVRYVVSSGKAGKVARDQITEPVTPLVVSFQTINLIITNEDASVGGDDIESLSSIKANAGRVFKTRQVAVTEQDYNALSSAFSDPLFGRVAVAKAISARSAASDVALQNLLQTIRDAVAAFVPAVTAVLDTANATLTELNSTTLTNLQTDLQDIATLATDVTTAVTDGLSSARTSKNKAIEVASEGTGVVTLAASLTATVSAIATGGSNQLLAATKTALLDAITEISGNGTAINVAGLLLQSSADAEAAFFGTAKDKVAEIGLDITNPGTELFSAETNRLAAEAAVVSLQANMVSISTLIIDQSTEVNDAADSIFAHVDAFLSADCKANLVSVPILARDTSGFYAEPSFSLIQALQTYLDARKEITHTVSVASGAPFLIRAVILIRLSVLSGFSESLTKASVDTVVDGVLRDREFGASLYLSDLYIPIRAVAGVFFVNVTIQGYLDSLDALQTGKLDIEGNLVIEKTEVVTKGTTTINTEIVSGSTS